MYRTATGWKASEIHANDLRRAGRAVVAELVRTSAAEYAIGVIKRIFRFQEVRHRSLAKNLHRFEVTPALATPYLVRRWLLMA